MSNSEQTWFRAIFLVARLPDREVGPDLKAWANTQCTNHFDELKKHICVMEPGQGATEDVVLNERVFRNIIGKDDAEDCNFTDMFFEAYKAVVADRVRAAKVDERQRRTSSDRRKSRKNMELETPVASKGGEKTGKTLVAQAPTAEEMHRKELASRDAEIARLNKTADDSYQLEQTVKELGAKLKAVDADREAKKVELVAKEAERVAAIAAKDEAERVAAVAAKDEAERVAAIAAERAEMAAKEAERVAAIAAERAEMAAKEAERVAAIAAATAMEDEIKTLKTQITALSFQAAGPPLAQPTAGQAVGVGAVPSATGAKFIIPNGIRVRKWNAPPQAYAFSDPAPTTNLTKQKRPMVMEKTVMEKVNKGAAISVGFIKSILGIAPSKKHKKGPAEEPAHQSEPAHQPEQKANKKQKASSLSDEASDQKDVASDPDQKRRKT
jgi:hypothetical protein